MDFKNSDLTPTKQFDKRIIFYITADEQWEKDLEAELQDYEVVNEGNDRTNWEKDVDELLEDENDLK